MCESSDSNTVLPLPEESLTLTLDISLLLPHGGGVTVRCSTNSPQTIYIEYIHRVSVLTQRRITGVTGVWDVVFEF